MGELNWINCLFFYFVLFYFLYLSFKGYKENNKKPSSSFDGKHVLGIPGIGTGISAKVVTNKDNITINNTQIIPMDRFQFARGVSAQEIVLDDQQKSVILRGIAGGLLLGPIGAVVGGMSGLGTKQQKKEVTQHYIQLTYTNKDNEQIDALFLVDRDKKYCDGVADHINKETGKIALVQKLQYEI
ncbi:hypothetical protein [Paenibacillus sp. HGH0039]|uniref:hypothetical protein n=1 Tax=Paenibacillus sp. HGH0039 TaxID=1078505 RepID=UPI00034E84B1|nr:hypothetical protein [Paenibacillus sp. HGH0039]EPD81994.1 hypothetical protein HMPREF1207_03820 [Paenibacillus sp. HGH0039]